jgi:hypothetical protein
VISISETSEFRDCSSGNGDGGAIYANQNDNNCKFSISGTTFNNCFSNDTTKIQTISLLISSYTSQIILFENIKIISVSSATLIFIKVNRECCQVSRIFLAKLKQKGMNFCLSLEIT